MDGQTYSPSTLRQFESSLGYIVEILSKSMCKQSCGGGSTGKLFLMFFDYLSLFVSWLEKVE